MNVRRKVYQNHIYIYNESNVYDEEKVLEEMSGPSQNILQVHNHIMPQLGNDSSSANRLISGLQLQESGLNDTVIAGVLTDNFVSVLVEIFLCIYLGEGRGMH